MKMKRKKMIVEDLEHRKSTSSLIVPILGRGSEAIQRPAGLSPDNLAAKEKHNMEAIRGKNDFEQNTIEHYAMKYGLGKPPIQAKYMLPRPIEKYGPGITPSPIKPPIPVKYGPGPGPGGDVMKYGPGITPSPIKPPIPVKYGPAPEPPIPGVHKYALPTPGGEIPPRRDVAIYSVPISPTPIGEIPQEVISLYSVKEPPKKICIGQIPLKRGRPPMVNPPVKRGSPRRPIEGIVGPALPQDPPIRALYSAPLYGNQ